MNIIPNELKITINTSIPGFQSIRYKPSMSFPDEKNDDTIYFNPLVKLNSSVIKSLPQEVQKKEFFNKGLFQSLINSHGLLKKKSLVEATKEGYVDNNIRVTLETLFPSNSVLYINKQPYAIADLQWTKGDWKIDKKTQQMPELESNKITDPYLYRTIVKDEIISGENELQAIPNDVVYGPNYTGPVNVASGVNVAPKSTSVASNNVVGPSTTKPSGLISMLPNPPTKLAKSIKPPPLPPKLSLEFEAREKEIQKQQLKLLQQQKLLAQQQKQLINKQKQTTNVKKGLLLQDQEQITKEREKILLQQKNLAQELSMLRDRLDSQGLKLLDNKENVNNSRYPLLPPSKPSKNQFLIMQPSKVEELEDKEINNVPAYNIVLETSENSTKTLQSFFGNDKYYFMLNTMFKNMSVQTKNKINEIFKQITKVDVKSTNNLSKTAYINTVQNMRVIKNSGGGNCFFIAVADAINYYNANVKNVDKIRDNNDEGNNIFTQVKLRKMVYNYILYKNTVPFEELVTVLEDNANIYNQLFRLQYDKYKETVLPNQELPVNVYFDIINNIYYGNDNFLIMKPSAMTKETLKTPFRMVKKHELENYINSSDYWANPISINALCENLGLNVIIIDNENDKMRIPYIYDGNKTWSKYLFLYHENNHYELITFDYINLKPVTKVIFKNNYLAPPFYIIFLIFASNYIKIADANDKKSFKLLSNLMNLLFEIFKKIESKPKNNKDRLEFKKTFGNYFLSSSPVMSRNLFDGGASSSYQNQRRRPYVSSLVRRNTSSYNENSKTNISYYITIDLYLKKGTELSNKDISDLKCNHHWNSIRKSYANLRGLNYVSTPDYNTLSSSSSKNKTNKNFKSKTPNYSKMNRTKKNYNK